MGLIHLTLPRAVMNRCGTGILLSFACVRLSAAIYPEYGVISQYEGRLLFDMMKLSYEDMTCWYYVIELVLALYPVGQKEDEAYDILMAAASAAQERNPRVIAFIAAIKLLASAGYDPAEAMETRPPSPREEETSFSAFAATAGEAPSRARSPQPSSRSAPATWTTSFSRPAIRR